MPVPPPPPPLPTARAPTPPEPERNLLAELTENRFDSWTIGHSPDLADLAPSENPDSASVTQAAGTVSPIAAVSTPDLPTLLADAQSRFDRVTDFTARLVKREVVADKPRPTEEAEYRFRQRPFSVYLKVTSDAGLGREVLYVRGRDDRGLHIVTGKGDHFLRGFKTTVPLNDPRLTEKSRYRADEAGSGGRSPGWRRRPTPGPPGSSAR